MSADAAIINEKGVHDGYNWEVWSGSNQGYVEIIPKSNGSFSCNWKETEEASFSVGKVYGSSGSSIEILGEI